MEQRLYNFLCPVSSLLLGVALFGESEFPHYQYILSFYAKSLTLHYSGSYLLAKIILTAMHTHHTELFIIIIITLVYFGKIKQK